MKNPIILFALLVLCIAGNAQTPYTKKVGSPIICKIIEIGEDEVKYKPIDHLDGPNYSISATKIKYIRLQNGTEHRFTDMDLAAVGADQKTLQKKNAVKIAPLSPLFGNLNFGFEHVQRFGLHWEGEVGIIGIGNTDNLNRNEMGGWIYGGPKMLLRKETYTKGERYYHYLHGTYFQTGNWLRYQTGIDSGINLDREVIESNYRLIHFGLMLNFGKQWVLADVMTLDIWAGFGMASNNLTYDRKDLANEYTLFSGVRPRSATSASGDNGQLSLSGNAGIKFGFISKTMSSADLLFEIDRNQFWVPHAVE